MVFFVIANYYRPLKNPYRVFFEFTPDDDDEDDDDDTEDNDDDDDDDDKLRNF